MEQWVWTPTCLYLTYLLWYANWNLDFCFLLLLGPRCLTAYSLLSSGVLPCVCWSRYSLHIIYFLESYHVLIWLANGLILLVQHVMSVPSRSVLYKPSWAIILLINFSSRSPQHHYNTALVSVLALCFHFVKLERKTVLTFYDTNHPIFLSLFVRRSSVCTNGLLPPMAIK